MELGEYAELKAIARIPLATSLAGVQVFIESEIIIEPESFLNFEQNAAHRHIYGKKPPPKIKWVGRKGERGALLV